MSTRHRVSPSTARERSRGASVVATASCLCLVLAACSWTGSLQPIADGPQSTPPTEAAIGAAVKEVFTKVKLAGAPEISELRRALPSAPADWLMCLRSNTPPFHAYALFFKGNEMADYRLAVLYDDCAREMYVPIAPEVVAGPAPR
jgi:hypothetical protein